MEIDGRWLLHMVYCGLAVDEPLDFAKSQVEIINGVDVHSSRRRLSSSRCDDVASLCFKFEVVDCYLVAINCRLPTY
jgi:hypothetical protein